MPQPIFDRLELKQLLKESLADTLIEQRELLHDVFEDVLEDISMVSAILSPVSAIRTPERVGPSGLLAEPILLYLGELSP